MVFSAVIAAMYFSVPSLSQANIDRLISRYVADNPPEIYVFVNWPTREPLYAALVRGGILRVVGSGVRNCEPESPEYDLTAYGRQVAAAKGWTIDKDGDVLITLGSLSIVHGSISTTKEQYQPARVRFDYWFHPNANASFLLSLAPSPVWGSVGMDVNHRLMLSQAGHLASDTLSVVYDDGWVVDQHIHGTVICN